MKYGSIIEAKVIDQNDLYYFVQADGITYQTPKNQLEDANIGETIEGMIYEDREGKLTLQVDLPSIRPGLYGWSEVVDVRRDLGLFVDIGLINKDIVISLDDLAEDYSAWPQKGDRLFVTFEADNKNRLWGKIGSEHDLHPFMKKARPSDMNKDIKATVFQPMQIGAQLITDEGFQAFIHKSETTQPLHLGLVIEGRIIEVHPDGRVNLSMKPRAHEAISDDATMIHNFLQKIPTGFLPLHDKSDPEEIRNQLGISKGQFKRAVGHLMKAGLIQQEKNKGIVLSEKHEE